MIPPSIIFVLISRSSLLCEIRDEKNPGVLVGREKEVKRVELSAATIKTREKANNPNRLNRFSSAFYQLRTSQTSLKVFKIQNAW